MAKLDQVADAQREDMSQCTADLIAAYERGVADLRTAVVGMTAEELRCRPIAGRWSTLEVVCHISDCEQFFADRMKRTLAMERPLLIGAEGRRYPEPLHYHQRDLAEEIELVALTRRQMARILRLVPADAWDRTAVHTETGLVTLRQLLHHAVNHLAHHIRFLDEKRVALGRTENVHQPPLGIGVQVRPVVLTDQPEWVRMRSALWPSDGANEHAEEVVAFFASHSFRWSQSFLAWQILVAERPSGGLCGFVEASIRPHVDGCVSHPVGYVEGWYVDPDMRRQGIGRKLLEATERWAVLQGCKEMASDADLENTVSHAAHKALGFDESERLVHFRKWLKDSSQVKSSCTLALPRLKLLGVAGSFAVCKLPTGSPFPSWAMMGDLYSITRTADELSVVCLQEIVPEGIACERGWRCLRVEGSMPFTMVGVIASLTNPIAKAGLGVFAVSTFDTDYLLIKAIDMPTAVSALRSAGHFVDVEEVMP